MLAADLVAYVTNADGGVDRVDDRAAHVPRLLSLQAPSLHIDVTQTVQVAADQAPAMVDAQPASSDECWQ